jgi:translation initiation factor IF-1
VKEELVETEGVIVAALAAGNFKVRLDGGHVVIARIAGRLVKHHIRILLAIVSSWKSRRMTCGALASRTDAENDR